MRSSLNRCVVVKLSNPALDSVRGGAVLRRAEAEVTSGDRRSWVTDGVVLALEAVILRPTSAGVGKKFSRQAFGSILLSV